jgi:hypothetical protein
MALDISEAVALAKDLLRTSDEFRPHDPALSAQFSHRAYEICDDLGIDHAMIGEIASDVPDNHADDDPGSAVAEVASTGIDDDAGQTSEQLRDLLLQQARVLQNVREEESAPKQKPKKRSFRLFGKLSDDGLGQFQSA